MQRGKWGSMEDFTAAGGMLGCVPPVSIHDELHLLCEWLAARQTLAERIASIEVVPCMTPFLPNGSWVRVALRQPVAEAWSGPFNEVGYHGTSMSNLARTIVRGLQEGWSSIGEDTPKPLVGIYLMGDDALDLCGTYSVYTPLQRSGYYYAPYLQVRYAHWPDTDARRHIAVKKGRATQYLTYQDVSFVSAVYFHVIAAADMLYGGKDQWINIKPERPASMELPTTDDDDVLHRRSHKRYLEAKAAGSAPEAPDE